MPVSQLDRVCHPLANRPASKPLIGVLPFYSYQCEFVTRESSYGEWVVLHRDSDARAFLSAEYRDNPSSETVYRVSTTLCDGRAEFACLIDAERFVATMLRCSAGRSHNTGNPRQGLLLSEFWWFAKFSLFHNHRLSG